MLAKSGMQPAIPVIPASRPAYSLIDTSLPGVRERRVWTRYPVLPWRWASTRASTQGQRGSST